MNQPITRPQPKHQRLEGRTEMAFKRPANHPLNQSNNKPAIAPQPIERPRVPRTSPIVEEESSTATVTKPLPNAAVKEHSEIDSDYISITLPSNFYFYPFKSISLRPVRANEQAKFNRAAKEGSMKHLTDAIGACLEPTRSAYELTPQDFRFIMYWLRLNSYSKMPWKHTTVCENQEHIQAVIDKQKTIETLNISTVITQTILTEKQLDIEKIYKPDSLPNGLKLGYLTMRDVVDISELDSNEDFEEVAWLADHAGFLAPRTQNEIPIMARVNLLRNLSPDTIEDIGMYLDSVSDYGITEKVTVRCGDCGAETVSTITINALTFLPAPRRAGAA